jgi:tetratricopeptide (TPR) repeat protein
VVFLPAQTFADLIMPRPAFIFALLLALCFTLATWLEPRSKEVMEGDESGSLLKTILGDGRRMFANHFYTKADVYFHSGYYPSFFEQAQTAAMNSNHMKEEITKDHDDHDEEEHEKEMDFLGAPKDWIDRFGRHFYPSTHTHLDRPGEAKEILPWLRLSAKLDPKKVDTYILGAYWMRKRLGKTAEAEQFLREGLRANPTNYEILFELGSLYYEDRHQAARARNLWELALRRWQEQDAAGKKPDETVYDKILAHLAQLEENEGNAAKAIAYLEQELKYSPATGAIKKHIEDLKETIRKPAAK